MMTEQKVYQKVLQKIIKQTDNNQISTSKQLLDSLIGELSRNEHVAKDQDKMYG